MLERNLIASSARSHASPACQKSGALNEQSSISSEALSCASTTRLHSLHRLTNQARKPDPCQPLGPIFAVPSCLEARGPFVRGARELP
jgi:hypothetical protein